LAPDKNTRTRPILFCGDSVETFQAGFGPNVQAIMGDIPNYTDASPVVQISEVVVERS
jgi:uncharacterized protein (TIGR02118 family)